MQHLMKYTYMLEVKGIKGEMEKLWGRYQHILTHPNWGDLNEARSILYLIGHIYCEQIAPEAIERRLHLLSEPETLIDFFTLVNSKSPALSEKRKDELFAKLEKYYLLIKDFKNRYLGGKYYMDEEKFMELYNRYNPDKELKMGEKGRFETKE